MPKKGSSPAISSWETACSRWAFSAAFPAAIKKNPAVRTQADQLIPQAVIRDRDTFIDATFQLPGKDLERK
ncbi:MAG: hypothetical protein ACR2FY_26290 [Pirellulaceae bacterium]